MKPETYVNFLVDTNAELLDYSSDADFFRNRPTFAFGLAEEVFEVLAAASDESRAKEVGDVVAYYCLLAVALGFSREATVQALVATSRQSNTTNTVADYLGQAKRYFRGDGDENKLLAEAYQLLLFSLSFSALQIEPVLELNHSKLTDRLGRTGTFHGSGDNR